MKKCGVGGMHRYLLQKVGGFTWWHRKKHCCAMIECEVAHVELAARTTALLQKSGGIYLADIEKETLL